MLKFQMRERGRKCTHIIRRSLKNNLIEAEVNLVENSRVYEICPATFLGHQSPLDQEGFQRCAGE